MTEHTPTPWELHAEHSLRVCKATKDGDCKTVLEAEIIGYDREEANANAKFAELACNSHDDLVAALEWALPRLHRVGLDKRFYLAKEALKKARGIRPASNQ